MGKVKHKHKKPTTKQNNKLHTFWQNPEHHLHNIFTHSIIYSATETFIPTRNYPEHRRSGEPEQVPLQISGSDLCQGGRGSPWAALRRD